MVNGFTFEMIKTTKTIKVKSGKRSCLLKFEKTVLLQGDIPVNAITLFKEILLILFARKLM